jgi:hypothetical protein
MKLLSWIRLRNDEKLTDVTAKANADARLQLTSEKFTAFLGGDPDTVQRNMLLAHTKGKAANKSAYPKMPVGLTLAIEDDQPDGEQSRFEGKRKESYGPWLELARKDDFIGVQTYTRQRIGSVHANLPPPKDAELTQSGFEFYPEALRARHSLRESTSGRACHCNRKRRCRGRRYAEEGVHSASRAGCEPVFYRTRSMCAVTFIGRCSTTSNGSAGIAQSSGSDDPTAYDQAERHFFGKACRSVASITRLSPG